MYYTRKRSYKIYEMLFVFTEKYFNMLRKQKCLSYIYLTIHSKNLRMRYLIRGFKWLEHKTQIIYIYKKNKNLKKTI